jgi:two-component system NtrC family sensor kinase
VTAITAARFSSPPGHDAVSSQLADLSHELRTPLNSVIGLSTILAREVYGPLTDKQAEFIAQIEASGRHLLAVVANILDLAKVDADRLLPERVDGVCVLTLVSEAVAMVELEAKAKGIAIRVQIPLATPRLQADPLRVRQVLINLLSNAVKFTDAGGSVVVEARGEGDLVAIEVGDTGIGIAEAHQETIFQPFGQVDASLARRHRGTGLGLALSRRLTELQGGRLEVRSVVGKGSLFTATFPRSASGELADPPMASLRRGHPRGGFPRH